MTLRAEVIRVSIFGKPVPAARPRVARGHAYTPKEYAEWKARAAVAIKVAARGLVLPEGPLWLEVTVYHPRPKTAPKHIPFAEWKAGGCSFAVTRSDLDNHVKAVADALQDSGVLDNDNRITHIVASSFYAPSHGDVVGIDVAIGAVVA